MKWFAVSDMDMFQIEITNEAGPTADEPMASIIPCINPKRPRPAPSAPARIASTRRPVSRRSLRRYPRPLSGCEKVTAVTPVPPPTVASGVVTLSRPRFASILLTASAFALAVVGITMNGWFARSLGSSDVAGLLFLAIGVAADLVALVMPACAASHWQACQRVTAAAGWAVWIMTFVFAVTAGVGFASVNIADVTLSRASRVTAAVTAAQAALSDAMTARDRECKGGIGKFCREREAAVNERWQALDTTAQAVAQTADPQTDAAIRIVAWASHGTLQPTGNDFAMLRLVLLALLPQIGGILLMVGRSAK